MRPGRLRGNQRLGLAAAAALWLPIAAGATGEQTNGPVAAATLTDAQVQAATRAIVDELYQRKDPQRFWDPPSWTDGQSVPLVCDF